MNLLHKINNYFSSLVLHKSYRRYLRAAKQGKIPSSEIEITPHQAGLFGALSSRYIAARIPQYEPAVWSELSPFLLMSENDSIRALAVYVNRAHFDHEEKLWLIALINSVLRTLPSSSEESRARAAWALTVWPTIYWRTLLDKDTKEILDNEFLKIFSSSDEIAPEIYDLLDEELRDKLKESKN